MPTLTRTARVTRAVSDQRPRPPGAQAEKSFDSAFDGDDFDGDDVDPVLAPRLSTSL